MPTTTNTSPSTFSSAKLRPWIRFACLGGSGCVVVWATVAFATSRHILDDYNNLVLSFVLPLIMAAVFWFVGLGAWRVDSEALAPLYFLTFASLLAAGVLSSVDATLGGPWFALFQIWIAPLFLHTHLQLSTLSIPKRASQLIAVLYILAAILTLPLLLVSAADWDTSFWFPAWRTALRLNLALALLATFLLIAQSYRANTAALERRRIRLLLCGTLLAMAPFLLLSLLPEILRFPYRLDYVWTLPFLLLNPLTYAYVSGLRQQQLRYEAIFQRFAIYYLASTLVIGGVFTGASLLRLVFRVQFADDPWVLLLAGVGSLVSFGPLLRWSQLVVRQIWYGWEIPASQMLTQTSEALARSLDWSSLEKLLLSELPSGMLLEHAALYLEKDFRGLTLVGVSGNGQVNALPTLLTEGQLINVLTQIRQPIFHDALLQKVSTTDVTSEERKLLAYSPSPLYWLPLMTGDHLHGLLIIGPRLGQDWVTSEDVAVLTTLTSQAGVAAHNVRLMEEVRARRGDLATAHQQLVLARENERQALARELHDDAIQQLIGVGYQVQLAQRRLTANSTVEPLVLEEMDSVNTNIVEVMRSLRLLVRELRPTGVEHMGLSATLHAFIQSMEALNPSIAWVLNMEPEVAGLHLPEETILGLFRIIQEAVRNSLRHADPQTITVTLKRSEANLLLSIEDDGCGFIIPSSPLENHFGLVGMRERAQLLGGSLQVDSKVGQGTTILVDLPLLGEIGDE